MNPKDQERLEHIVVEEVLRHLGVGDAQPATTASAPACPNAVSPASSPDGGCPAGTPEENPPLLLLTGAIAPSPEIWEAIADVGKSSSRGTIVLSRSFVDHTRPGDVARILKGWTIHTPPLSERQLLALADAHGALLIPTLSPNTAAKGALGIHDSEPSVLLRLALQMRMPAVALSVGLEPGVVDCPMGVSGSAPPPMTQIVNSHRLALERMGMRFVRAEDFAAEARLALLPKDTAPRTLPGEKPPLRRRFVTEQDLRDLRQQGKTSLDLPAGSMLTDAARDYAAGEDIDIRILQE